MHLSNLSVFPSIFHLSMVPVFPKESSEASGCAWCTCHKPHPKKPATPGRTRVPAADTVSKELRKQNAEGRLFPELSASVNSIQDSGMKPRRQRRGGHAGCKGEPLPDGKTQPQTLLAKGSGSTPRWHFCPMSHWHEKSGDPPAWAGAAGLRHRLRHGLRQAEPRFPAKGGSWGTARNYLRTPSPVFRKQKETQENLLLAKEGASQVRASLGTPVPACPRSPWAGGEESSRLLGISLLTLPRPAPGPDPAAGAG